MLFAGGFGPFLEPVDVLPGVGGILGIRVVNQHFVVINQRAIQAASTDAQRQVVAALIVNVQMETLLGRDAALLQRHAEAAIGQHTQLCLQLERRLFADDFDCYRIRAGAAVAAAGGLEVNHHADGFAGVNIEFAAVNARPTGRLIASCKQFLHAFRTGT